MRDDILPPPILYSYSPGGDWLPACLAGKSLRFSSRLAFNDPFDSRPGYYVDQGRAGTEWLKERVYRLTGVSPAEKLRTLQRCKHQSRNPRQMEEFMTEAMLNDIGILCLTEQWNEPLFWGHYAAKHTGICIGFSTDLDVFRLAEKIVYQDELPVILRPQDDNETMVQKALLTKSRAWEYECEWRLLKHKLRSTPELHSNMDPDERMHLDQRGPGIYQFDPNTIESLTMGMNMPTKVEEFIKASVRDTGRNIQLFKAARHPTMYKIERKPVRY